MMDVVGSRTIRVLVVDDSEDLRLLLRVELGRRDGFTVVAEAGDGAAAVAAAVEHQPDVVLLDVAMPVMDGLEALTLIREQCPDTRVVMLSGFGESSEVGLQALRLGAHGYIEKSAPLGRVARQLRDIMRPAAT